MPSFYWLLGAVLALGLDKINCLPSTVHEHAATVNNRPIIGVLAQEYTSSCGQKAPEGTTSYIAASYIKFVEGGGARAVPIKINQPDTYYDEIFKSINGVLFPGGAASLRPSRSGYAKAASILYQKALTANDEGDFFPVWGTCLGFEELTYLSAGNVDWLKRCEADDMALTLAFTPDASGSRMFSQASPELVNVMQTENVAANFHHWCMTPQNFTASGLDLFYKTLATSQDANGLTFIAAIEAINYPIYGVQFHPEKNIYEWEITSGNGIPHGENPVLVGQYFAQILLQEVRKNTHKFDSIAEEEAALIYGSEPVYTGDVCGFQQCYFF